MSDEKVTNVFENDDEAKLETKHISVLAQAMSGDVEGLTAEDFERAAVAFMNNSKKMMASCLTFEEASRDSAELCVNFAEALRSKGLTLENQGANGNGS